MNRLALHASLIDGIDVPIFLISIDNNAAFKIVKINSSHEKVFGLKSSEIRGLTPHDILAPRVADRVVKHYQLCCQTGRVHSYDFLTNIPTGEIWMNTTVAPIRVEGVIIGLIGLISNISAQKQTESRFIEALREVRRANSDLQILISATAHDLRGPLRQAKLINDIILETHANDQPELMKLLKLEGDVLDRALEQIDADLTNIVAPQELGHDSSTIDFSQWCQNITAVLDPLKVVEFLSPNIVLECESFVLDIALRNIIDNALKHATSKVIVEVEALADMLVFTVYDDGPGFDNAIYPVNQKPTIKRKNNSGNGFGLASTIGLIEQRGGRVWVNQPHQKLNGGAISFSMKGAQASELAKNVAKLANY